jgi:ABC-type transport system involved in multi-copper enzyme maturation permease subunit
MTLRQCTAVLREPRRWREPAIGLALLGAALGLAWAGSRLPMALVMSLWVLWSVAFAVTVGCGWLRLFGPLLLYDLLRLARRRRYLVIRTIYAVTLLSLLAALYSYWVWNLPRGTNPAATELTRFAETFFFTFMCVEFVAVLLLTPVYAAGAVAEEKDRQTLEFLLATDLDKREIVLSKLAARLVNLALLVLVGLPILSVTQFFGGIDPDLVFTGFAVLGLTLASLTAVSMLHSIYARKARTAIVLTYLTTFLYLGLGFLGAEYLPEAPAMARLGFTVESDGVYYSFTLQSLVDALNTGNLIVALRNLVAAWKQNQALSAVVPGVLAKYAIFHTVVFVGCTTWAVARLRAAARAPLVAPKRDTSRPRWWDWPSLDTSPLLWKELVIEPGFRFGRLTRLLVLALALASFVPALATCYNFLIDRYEGPAIADVDRFTLPQERRQIETYQRAALILVQNLRRDIQEWLKTVGTLVICLTVLVVAVRAAGSVSGERERQTLDSVLTTPLNRDSILDTKWWAALLSVRWTWLWLGLMWAVGLVTGGLSIYALPVLMYASVVYAMFAANVGIWFSTWCRSTLRATVATLLTMAAVGLGHWLMLGCYLPFFLYSSGRSSDFPEWVILFQKYGLTPPLTLQALTFQMEDLRQSARIASDGTLSQRLGMLVAAVAGVFCYNLLASLIWKLAAARFRVLGIAQPLHQGVFPDSGNPFLEQGAVPLAAPVDEVETHVIVRDALMIEEQHEA